MRVRAGKVFNVKALPERPNLDHLRQQAKDLLAQLRASNPETPLASAQTLLAEQYGFRTWPDLKAEVDRRRGEREASREVPMERSGVPVRLQPGRGTRVRDEEGREVGSVTALVLKTLRDQPVLRTAKSVQRAEGTGEVIDRVFQTLIAQGLMQAGPPYESRGEADDEGMSWVEVGIPVNRDGISEGAVEAAVLPGGDVATALYAGPFRGLPAAHQQLRTEIDAGGLRTAGAPRVLYHTAPEETDPDNHLTELVWPVEVATG